MAAKQHQAQKQEKAEIQFILASASVSGSIIHIFKVYSQCWVINYSLLDSKIPLGTENCGTAFPQGNHPPCTTKAATPVALPSANGFNKPFAARKYEKLNARK